MVQLIRRSLLTSVVGVDRLIRNISLPQQRRNKQSISNDEAEKQFETFNCKGVVLDWDLSNAADGLFTKVVEFDYDLFVEQGSDVTIALTTVQDTLLRHVGNDVVSDCSNRSLLYHQHETRQLSVGNRIATARRLDDMVIQEISSAPADTVSSSPCFVEGAEFSADADCYPIIGSISVYYMSSGDFISDVSNIDKAVKDSVKDAIAEGALVTDTSAVYYLGNRETHSLDSSLPLLNVASSTAIASTEDETSAGVPWWVVLVGLVGVLMVVLLAAGFWLKKKRSSRKNGIVVPIKISYDLDEELPKSEFIIEKFDETVSEMTEENQKSNTNCSGLPLQCVGASPTGCNFFGCLNTDHEEPSVRTEPLIVG